MIAYKGKPCSRKIVQTPHFQSWLSLLVFTQFFPWDIWSSRVTLFHWLSKGLQFMHKSIYLLFLYSPVIFWKGFSPELQLLSLSVVLNCTQKYLSLILVDWPSFSVSTWLASSKTPTLQWFQEKRNITARFPQRFCMQLIHLTSKIINYGKIWTASMYSPFSIIRLTFFFIISGRVWRRHVQPAQVCCWACLWNA